MSALAKKSREAMQAKARRLAGETVGKVDSSNWTPPAPMNTAQKFDMPGDPRARATYKRGGAVGKASGGSTGSGKSNNPYVYEGRTPDASSDKSGNGYGGDLSRTSTSNGARTPKKSGGGNWIKDAIKKPGALHKSLGVKEGEKIPEKKLEKAEHSKNKLTAKRARLAETLKGMNKKDGGSTGKGKSDTTPESYPKYASGTMTAWAESAKTPSRPARASGGKVKGKTNISVNILSGGKPAETTPAMMPAPGLNPMPAPPPAPAPAAPPPALPIPNSPMPMGRKAGGRVYRSYKDMDAGACSGEGRLEKTEIQKNKRA